VGLDGSALAEDALRAAAALARPGARCTAVRVAVPPQGPGSPYIPDAARVNRDILVAMERSAAEYLGTISDRVRGQWGGFDTRVVSAYQPARVLVDTAVELDADLIAIATHGRGPVMRALIGSVTDRVVRLAPVPVLVVPAHASTAHLVTGHIDSREHEALTH
jgi:nucleotide-binding universal stress UspA family protein